MEGPIHQVAINHNDPSPSEIVCSLFRELITLLTPRTKAANPVSKVRHTIDTGDRSPSYAKMKQVSKEKLKAAMEEFSPSRNHKRVKITLVITPAQGFKIHSGEPVETTEI